MLPAPDPIRVDPADSLRGLAIAQHHFPIFIDFRAGRKTPIFWGPGGPPGLPGPPTSSISGRPQNQEKYKNGTERWQEETWPEAIQGSRGSVQPSS